MNKYKAFSQARVYRACVSKAAYPTYEAALIRNVKPYACRHCGKWHRASTLPKAQPKPRPKRTDRVNRKAARP